MNIRPTTFLIVACLFTAPAFPHSGDEPPVFVAAEGVDAGNCRDAENPCRTIDFALSQMGKGAQIRVASGRYSITSDNELFHLLNGSIDIRGGFEQTNALSAEPASPTILAGVPRDYSEALAERGFFVGRDGKAIERDNFKKVRSQLKVHEALKASMPATPCVGGTINGMNCQDIDLLSHVGMRDISANPGSGADVWGFVDLNSNREYAIMSFDIGTAVFDVTDAENPREVDFIDGQRTSWRDVKVYQFWNTAEGRWNAQAYITTDGSTDGLFVIDLSGLPHRISRVNYNSDFLEAHNVFATSTDYGTGLSLGATEPTIVIAGSEISNGPYRSYSVSDPAAPMFESMPGSGRANYMHDAASMIITDSRKDTQCVNATTYCEVLFDFNEDEVLIWDITDAGNPQRLSNTTYPNAGYVHSGWPTEDKQTLYIHDEFDERTFGLPSTVNIFDLSNLSAPSVLSPFRGPTAAIDHNGFVRGNRYYMSNYERGLTILDITNPASPQAVGHIDTFPASDSNGFSGAWGAFPYFHSGNIAVSDIDSGFYMVADRTREVAAGRLAFSSRSYGGSEGTQLQIPVQRLGGSTGDVSVAYEILGGTADGSDAYTWVVANRSSIIETVTKQAPTWTPRFVDGVIGDRVHLELVRFLAAVRDDPEHDVRVAIDRLLGQFAEDLRTNPDTQARVENAKVDLYNHPDVQRSVGRIWETAQRVLLEAADDPSSELRMRAAGALAQLGESLATDAELQVRLDGWVTDTVAGLVADYKVELTSVITDTVARWDGKQTAERIELAAGRDLQFIRINGTVVGALAGLVIHAISQLA